MGSINRGILKNSRVLLLRNGKHFENVIEVWEKLGISQSHLYVCSFIILPHCDDDNGQGNMESRHMKHSRFYSSVDDVVNRFGHIGKVHVRVQRWRTMAARR